MRREVLSTVFVSLVTFVVGTTLSLSVSATEQVSVLRAISVPVYFLSATGELLPTATIPRDLTLQLSAITGSFGGSPDLPLQTNRVGSKNEIRLDLADLSAKLSVHAARFSERDDTPLELTPSEVRFARVSTGALSGLDVLTGLAVSFWDLEAKGSLVLIYCDRPCRLRAPKLADDFKFEVPSPGLVWMLNTKDENARFVHTRAINPHPVIVIAPPEALDRISPSLERSRGK